MKRYTYLIYFCLASILATSSHAKPVAPHQELIQNSKNIIFLGDSITYAGTYVSHIETWLTLTYPKQQRSVINLGLGSETVSGLSEKGHAGGRFPRPDLFERLDRVLTKTKPDLIFACYGMNCGIYQPLDKERFQKYQAGITKLKTKAEAAGAQIIFITPANFDAQIKPKQEYYADVLKTYSTWLVSQRKNGWNVIDVNTHMGKTLQQQRRTNPKFTYQKDGVHPNQDGHWVMTQPILAWFGDNKSANSKNPQEMVTHLGGSPELLQLINQRAQILRNAWLTETGHKRPKVPKGLPLNQAKQKAASLTKAINAKL
ncbi:MAG: SGNH/GDSL hydrolase family protein [Akkermansiaceae bacterium]